MNKYLFVGERRSQSAIAGKWTFDECARTGDWHLCAVQLFRALTKIGIKPEQQKFVNLWTDSGRLTPGIQELLKKSPYTIVAMGRKVEMQLQEWKIKHIFIFHPASRGVLRQKNRYSKHVSRVLNGQRHMESRR